MPVSYLPDLDKTPVSDMLRYARETLSGKRLALVGFKDASAGELARIITEADAFTRRLSLEVHPSADVLKPFELLLINIESAIGTHWLNPNDLAGGIDRCIAVGHPHALLALLADSPLACREFCAWPATAEELFLRCVLALRCRPHTANGSLPTGSTIVLADDDPSITALLRLTLQRNGMTCEIASNGGDALALINRVKPCAAVLDVGMPGINGFEVLSRLRSVPDLAQTRVILLTGCEQETDIVRGFTLGADDYVTKPFNPMELMMRVKRVIGRI